VDVPQPISSAAARTPSANALIFDLIILSLVNILLFVSV
jgi:hypothetical protein